MTRTAERQVLKEWSVFLDDAPAVLDAARDEAASAVRADLRDVSAPVASRTILRLRYQGQEQVIDVETSEPASARALFERRYEEMFGAAFDGVQDLPDLRGDGTE